MDKKAFLELSVSVADYLDKNDMEKEAEVIDNIMTKVAEMDKEAAVSLRGILNMVIKAVEVGMKIPGAAAKAGGILDRYLPTIITTLRTVVTKLPKNAPVVIDINTFIAKYAAKGVGGAEEASVFIKELQLLINKLGKYMNYKFVADIL